MKRCLLLQLSRSLSTAESVNFSPVATVTTKLQLSRSLSTAESCREAGLRLRQLHRLQLSRSLSTAESADKSRGACHRLRASIEPQSLDRGIRTCPSTHTSYLRRFN